MGDEVFDVLGLSGEGFEKETIDGEVDPKSGEGLGFMKNNVFIIGGDLPFLGGVVFGAAGIGRVKGSYGSVIGIIMAVGSFATKDFHVFLRGVSNNGKGLTHGNPADEKVTRAINVSGVSGAARKIDAAAKVAVIGAMGVACFFSEGSFTKVGVAAFTDGVAYFFTGAMEEGDNFGGGPGMASAIRFHALEGGEEAYGFFPALDSLGSLGSSGFLIPVGRELSGFFFLG